MSDFMVYVADTSEKGELTFESAAKTLMAIGGKPSG